MLSFKNSLAPVLLGIALTGGLLFTAIQPPALAQVTSGSIVGLVKDSQGSVVTDATVVATNTATGIAVTGKSNSQGEYRFENLPAGTYNIEVSSSGFEKYLLKGFAVELNKTSTRTSVCPWRKG